MPGMTGLELARKIYAIRPELAVVVTTGFGGDLISPARLAGLPNIRRVIEKALNPDAVVRVVADLLATGPAGLPGRPGS